jgi:hypothetical protein
MFQIYLHLTHQNIVLKERFKVQEIFWVFFLNKLLKNFSFFLTGNHVSLRANKLEPWKVHVWFEIPSYEYQEYSAGKWISHGFSLETYREKTEDFSRLISAFIKLVNILKCNMRMRNVVVFIF